MQHETQSPDSGASPLERGAGRFAARVVIVLALVGVAYLLVTMASFLLMVFAAVVLAVVFDTLATAIGKHTPLGRGLALTLSALILLGVFVGALFLFGAQLAGEFDAIRAALPKAVDKLQQLLGELGIGPAVQQTIAQAKKGSSDLLGNAGGYVMTMGTGLTNLVLIIAGALFIAGSPQLYRRGLLLLVPEKAEAVAEAALDDAWMGLTGWMRGQVISSILVAILTWGGLALLGIPSAAGLGLIAGLLDVIPLIGPVIAGTPAVLLALTVSPMTALWTAGLYLVVQQLQGNLLQPMIQKQAVNIPPAILLFAVVAAGTLFGMLGILLAAPLTICLYVLVQRIYVKTLLGKPIEIGNGED